MINGILFFLLLPFSILRVAAPHRELPPLTGMIKAGNLLVYYERQGTGSAILLLHAGLQDHTMWSGQVKALAKHHTVITIDLPYHGKTVGADTGLLAQDVVKIVLDSLQVQKISIAGLSMGASVAQDFIIAYPQRVNKAVLVSAGINGYDSKFTIDSASMDWFYRFDTALKRKDTARAAIEFTRAWAEGIYRRSDRLKSPVSQYVRATTLANLKQHHMEGWPKLQDNPPAFDRLGAIHIPVLIIEGDKDLPYIRTTSAYLAKTIPGAKQVTIKNAAHMLNMEKPEEFNKLLDDFLRSE